MAENELQVQTAKAPQPATEILLLTFAGVKIWSADGMVSLTSLWKAAGSPSGARPPRSGVDQPNVGEFIEYIEGT